MGNHCGDLGVNSGIAEGVEMIITPDHPMKDEDVFKKLKELQGGKKKHSLVIVSEHMYEDIHAFAKRIQEETGIETRAEVLGRLQRGGEPAAHDRILAARLGAKAVDVILDQDMPSSVVGIKNSEVVTYPIDEAIQMKHRHIHGLRDLIDMLQ